MHDSQCTDICSVAELCNITRCAVYDNSLLLVVINMMMIMVIYKMRCSINDKQ